MADSQRSGSDGPRPAQAPPAPEPSARREGMWLSDLSIGQPVFITMVMLAVIVTGIIAYTRMSVDLLPDISFPVVAVRTVYPGTSPEEIERSVTKPIEDAVASINGVDTINSTSSDSVSSVVIQFVLERDSKVAADDVKARLDLIRNSLPSDARDPVVQRFDPSAAPILSVAFADRTGKVPPQALRSLVEDTLRPRIERAKGVASVSVSGGRVREIHVDLKANPLQAHGVTADQVISAIRGGNSAVPAGRITESRREESLRTAGELRSLAEIGEVPVPIPGTDGASVRVRDLGAVSDATAEVRALSRLDGQDSILATVQKQSGTNTVQTADAVKAELARIARDYPDIDIGIADDQSTFVKEAVQDVQTTLLLGALLAAVVVLLFFRDFRNTIITVAGLPVVMLGTFGAMGILGFGLNMVTTLALSLSVGLLIDDAIVVRENILRHIDTGEHPRIASRRGTAEIALAVLAVSSTIVAVFLPIAFTGGIIGKFLASFGVTVSVAVIVSLIEAFTLAPMLSAYFFRPSDTSTGNGDRPAHGASHLTSGRMYTSYRRLLELALRRRWLVVGAGMAVFVASLTLFSRIPVTFISDTDQAQFSLGLEMPPGTTLADTDAAARAVEDALRAHQEVDHVFTSVGSADGAVENAAITVKLRARGRTAATMAALRPELEQAAGPGAKLKTVLQGRMGGPQGAAGSIQSLPIQLAVRGQNYDELDAVSRELVDRLRQIPGTADVDRSAKPGKPGRDIVVDRLRASDLGISPAQVGATVRTLVNGQTAASYRAGEKSVDIVVRLEEGNRTSTRDVLSLPIATPKGVQVPLSSVARIVQVSQPIQILRQDRQRQVLVGTNAIGRPQTAVTADVQRAVAALRPSLPPGVSVVFTGQVQQANEAFSGLLVALGLSIMFVYMILASQFGSFVHPFTIMLALPFSLVGALVALFLAGKNLDMMGMIGIILLMGLVTKNSILLVDFANRRLRAGSGAREAMLEAGPVRLRPILMTTLAMIFGMVPAASGLGAGAELRQTMGIAVIGGLLVSTLLTLFVVPVAYTLIDDLTRRIRHRAGQPKRAPAKAAQALPHSELEPVEVTAPLQVGGE